MSMIGKLRQVSNLPDTRKSGEMIRALAGGPLQADPQMYARMREMLQLLHGASPEKRIETY
jgi:hypothetical protein